MTGEWPTEWQIMKLENCMEVIIDYRGKTPRKTSFGTPLITAKIVKGGRIETPDEFIDPSSYEEWMRRGFPKRGDVLITTEAPLGEVAQIDNPKVALAQRLIALRGKFDVLDNTFLKFLMQSNFVQTQLTSRSSGTTVTGIKQSELRKIDLPIPPLTEQKAIAHILGTLDDKIELNRKMNKTLEEMARSIFKSWFVDFDPVHAKAAVRLAQPDWTNAQISRVALPNLKPEIAELFPDSFEDSELGKIPQGWRVLNVDDVCEFAYGKALKADQRQPGLVPVMGSNGQVGSHNEALVKGPGVVVGRKGNPGVITWINSDFFPIDTTFYVVPKSSKYPLTFLVYALEKLNLAILSADSAVPGLNRNIAYKSQLILPADKILKAFEIKATLIRDRQGESEKESQKLAEQRDALLPRLISGELRVMNLEKANKEFNNARKY